MIKRARYKINWGTSFAQILMLCGIIILSYLFWQYGYSAVISAKAQEKVSYSFTKHDYKNIIDGKVAKIHQYDPNDHNTNPPTEQGQEDTSKIPCNTYIGKIYYPKKSLDWNRTIVQCTDLPQLNLFGYGHYNTSSLPGSTGNFAIAAHKAGYGDPGDILYDMKEGDHIYIRTNNYWYQYTVKKSQVLEINDVWAVNPMADISYNGSQTVTNRLITLTTCWPRGWTPSPKRYGVFGEFTGYYNASEGTPKELLQIITKDNKTIVKVSYNRGNPLAKIPDLKNVTYITIPIAVLLIILGISLDISNKKKIILIKEKNCGILTKLFSIIPGHNICNYPLSIAYRILILIFITIILLCLSFETWYPYITIHVPILAQETSFI